MNKFFKIIFLSIIISFLLIPAFTPSAIQAQSVNEEWTQVESQSAPGNRILDRMKAVAEPGGYDTSEGSASVPRIVGSIINGILSIIGLVFLILTVFAGFNWMTSQGNDEKIKKSKDTLTSSVIGLIVTLSAWTIWNFIFFNLIK